VFGVNLGKNTAVNCFQAQSFGEGKRVGFEADRVCDCVCIWNIMHLNY